MLPMAHGAHRAAGRHPPASTSATPPSWAELLARRRRGLPPGRASSARGCRSATCPTTPATTTSAPPRCWPRCTTPASTGWCWPRRWSSTARAATRCPEHGDQAPPPRAVEALEAGDFENHCPVCGRAAGLGAGRRGRPARPALVVRRQQGRPGALHRRVGPPGRGAGGRAAVPQRLRPRDAAGHAVLRGGGDVPLLARARRAAAGLRGRRADARLRARLRRGPRQPGRAARGRWPTRRRPYAAYNVASGHPVSILDVARLGGRGHRPRRSRPR